MMIDNLLNEIQSLKIKLDLKDSQLKDKDKKISVRDKLIINLQDALLLLRRKKFAPSSETSTEQGSLFNEVEDILKEDIEENSDEEEDPIEDKKKKKRGKRKKLPEILPRIDNVIEPEEKEKYDRDGIELECIGEEVSEQLKITPAKVEVIRNIKKIYKTPDHIIISGKLPDQLLPKTMASPSLIAYIITSKYVDALPLYRQETIFKRIEADLNRQTMVRWLIKVAGKLTPLYNLLQDYLLEKNYIHMDETYTQVLKEEGKKATSKSYMWVRCAPGNNPIVLFDYSPSRAGAVPLELLEGFQGALQVDGYDGYAAAIRKFGLKRLGVYGPLQTKVFRCQ